MAQALPDYGSTEPTGTGSLILNNTLVAKNERDKSFNTDNIYYLKDESTPAQRWRKLMLTSIPIILALAIVGGFALYLVRDFGTLYPSPGSGSSKSTSTTVRVRDKNSAPSPVPRGPSLPTNTKHASSSSGDAACSAHEGCSSLVGDCCPSKGIVLECCN
jgi:hypothetical protein